MFLKLEFWAAAASTSLQRFSSFLLLKRHKEPFLKEIKSIRTSCQVSNVFLPSRTTGQSGLSESTFGYVCGSKDRRSRFGGIIVIAERTFWSVMENKFSLWCRRTTVWPSASPHVRVLQTNQFYRVKTKTISRGLSKTSSSERHFKHDEGVQVRQNTQQLTAG